MKPRVTEEKQGAQKASALHSAFFAIVWFTHLSPGRAHPSPPPADSAHFCAFNDYVQWRRDHPQPAAKRLANLNAGEPRTVRMIYNLLPAQRLAVPRRGVFNRAKRQNLLHR